MLSILNLDAPPRSPGYKEAKEILIWWRTPTTASLHGSARTDADANADLRGKRGDPIAHLGWSCIGAPDENEAERRRNNTCEVWRLDPKRTCVIRALFTNEPVWSDRREICCDIDNSLKRFWEIQTSGLERTDRLVLTDEERLALNKVKDSLKYVKGRYRVAVPWKEAKPEISDTKPMALFRLRSTERKLRKDDSVAENYKNTIQDYIEKGYLRRVPLDEQLPNNVWYLPHFLVVRMDKTTTKVRIVFDCDAKCNGISLNDTIFAAPILQQDLFNVLVRFADALLVSLAT